MTRAPELLEMSAATDKADVWALGCVMYFFATGKKPEFNRKLLPAIIRELPLRMGTKIRHYLRITLQVIPEFRCGSLEAFEWLTRRPKKLPGQWSLSEEHEKIEADQRDRKFLSLKHI
jgi:serine/threonine protein kinase